MHEAVCQHLGIQPPFKVGEIRKSSFKSRSDASELTGIGEASLGRWERGASTQSLAFDRYLFLLSFRENVQRLRRYVAASLPERKIIPFPTLVEEQVSAQKQIASEFQLHPQSSG